MKRAKTLKDRGPTLRGRVFRTRVGWVGIAWSARGLAAVAGPAPQAPEAELELRARVGYFLPVQKPPSSGLGWALEEKLQAYLNGQRVSFDEPIDLSRMAAFTRRVLEVTQAIPYGEVRTYAGIAAEVGNPRAARAVGRALGANPMPFVIPCHRVIASDGGLCGYGLGLPLKARLLAMEGRPVREAQA
ncbi:MAG: methylated-DNA--[protein]-cysteine S-methyltransferase [Chloroflexi bacterium]|nr:methylated-DNA--[protein]-cysteine S-methyltransferase [Chloroflexota bacterium]